MMNRFEKCNSLMELFQVIFGEEMVDFSSLTNEEKKTLLEVYKDCNGPNAHMMAELTISNYNAIIKNAYEIANNLKKVADDMNMKKKMEEEEMMTGTVANENSKTTGGKLENFKRAVDDSCNKINTAAKGVIVRVGEDANDFKTSSDNAITGMKDSLATVLEKLDMLTGFTSLKNTLMAIIYKDVNGAKSRTGFFDCAEELRKTVQSYINDLLDMNPDADDLKTVIALRYMLAEDENGNKIEGKRSIFKAFANGVVWVCKKVARKLKSWFSTDATKNIFGSVGAGIASVFGVACGIIKGVVQLAITFVTFVGSYILSAIITAIAFVTEKISNWAGKAKEKFSKKDAQEDEALNETLQEEENAEEHECEEE